MCDISATGHICNDLNLFKESLVQANIVVNIATELPSHLDMGVAVISMQNAEEVKYTFVIVQVVYIPKSPVNILSTKMVLRAICK